MKILLAGRKRSGKDTAAEYLTKIYGGKSFSFAGPIYDIMYAYQDRIGVPRFKDRPMLQMIGDYGRKTDPLIWIKLCLLDARKANVANKFITDGRYENELNAARADGYLVVEIRASDNVRMSRLDPDDTITDGHSSENGYRPDYPFDAIITNDLTIEQFHETLHQVGAAFMSGQ